MISFQRAGTVREDGEARTWPEIVTADTRRILRNHPLTLPLTRAIEDVIRRGLRAALVVSRRAASLICAECGTLLRCPDCGVPFAYSRAARALSCQLCARAAPMPDRCPGCGGHKLSPLGWDAERVEEERRNECLGRFERYLRRTGVLTDALAEEAKNDALARMKAGIAAAEAMPPPDPEIVFAHAYVDPPPGLRDG